RELLPEAIEGRRVQEEKVHPPRTRLVQAPVSHAARFPCDRLQSCGFREAHDLVRRDLAGERSVELASQQERHERWVGMAQGLPSAQEQLAAKRPCERRRRTERQPG